MPIAQLEIPEGMIDLAPGQPSPGLLPLDLIREAAGHRLDMDDSRLLAYGTEQGDGRFRMSLAGFLTEKYGIRVRPDQLFITPGASMGLDLICTLFTNPGDTIFVEEPSYFLALRIFADHGLNVVGLPMDQEGLLIEALEERLSRQVPAFLYSIPTFHNPSSVTLSLERRQRVAQLSRQYGFYIVADEVYHLLDYTNAPPPPIAGHIDTNQILSLGSFSKIMAPGLRLGWIQTGSELMERLRSCGLLKSGGGLNPFTSSVIGSAIELGLQERQLAYLKDVYSRRRKALSLALSEHLPESVRFTEPEGGFYFWLEFPEDMDTDEMLARARRKQVGYLPGSLCSHDHRLKNYARLSLSYFDIPELEEGARRLGKVIRDRRY